MVLDAGRQVQLNTNFQRSDNHTYSASTVISSFQNCVTFDEVIAKI